MTNRYVALTDKDLKEEHTSFSSLHFIEPNKCRVQSVNKKYLLIQVEVVMKDKHAIQIITGERVFRPFFA